MLALEFIAMVNLPNLPAALARNLAWPSWQVPPAAATAVAGSSANVGPRHATDPATDRQPPPREPRNNLRGRRQAPLSLTPVAHHRRGADSLERDYRPAGRSSYVLGPPFAGRTPLVPPDFYNGVHTPSSGPGYAKASFVGASELLGPCQPLTPANEARARRELAAIVLCPAARLPLVDPVFDVALRRNVERSADPDLLCPAESLSFGAEFAETGRRATLRPATPRPTREDLVMREVSELCRAEAHLPLLDLWHALHRALRCPIALELLEDPCIDGDGHTFSRAYLQRALEDRPSCPLSRAPLGAADLMEHKTLRALTTWMRDVVFWSAQQSDAGTVSVPL